MADIIDLAGAELGKKIFEDLLTSNADYVKGESKAQAELSPPDLREDLGANGQKPVAAIVACADSRVAPEIVFGQGIGRLFVVRNAGNCAWGDSVVGSLEYAVEHLGVPLVIVLGHSKCGAVGAAVGMVKDKGAGGETALGKHVERIADVVRSVVDSEDAVKDGVQENVKDGVARLLGGNGVGRKASDGGVAVMGAVYDIESGQVAAVA